MNVHLNPGVGLEVGVCALPPSPILLGPGHSPCTPQSLTHIPAPADQAFVSGNVDGERAVWHLCCRYPAVTQGLGCSFQKPLQLPHAAPSCGGMTLGVFSAFPSKVCRILRPAGCCWL